MEARKEVKSNELPPPLLSHIRKRFASDISFCFVYFSADFPYKKSKRLGNSNHGWRGRTLFCLVFLRFASQRRKKGFRPRELRQN